MLLHFKSSTFLSPLSCLKYGLSGVSCQQVCLVSDPGGEKIFVGITFLRLFSKNLSTLLEDSLAESDIPTVIIPVPYNILKQLLDFLSKGQVVCTDFENAFSVGKAADVLGISNIDWNIESSDLQSDWASTASVEADDDLKLGGTGRKSNAEQNLLKRMEKEIFCDGKQPDKLSKNRKMIASEEAIVNIDSEIVCKHCGEAICGRGGVKIYAEKHKCQMKEVKRRKIKVAKFLPSWLDMTIKGQSVATWLAHDPENIQRASCTMCPKNVTFNINEGWASVMQHYRTAKHQKNLKSSLLHA